MRIFKVPKLVYSIYSKFVWEIQTDKKEIFLTFDDGPNPGTSNFILECLDKYNAKATFFFVGENIKKYPETFEKFKNRGHSFGNHTYSHLKNRDYTTEEYISNVQMCSELVDSKLFRPPYGRITQEQAEKLMELGYKIIMYTVLTNDFNQKVSQDMIVRKSIKQTSPGSIVVFHDSEKAGENMIQSLPKFLDFFSSYGYTFNPLTESIL